MKEHDGVVLTQDLIEEGLRAGDTGTVVHVHAGGALRGRAHDLGGRDRRRGPSPWRRAFRASSAPSPGATWRG